MWGISLLEGADPRRVVEDYRELIREFHFHGVVERTQKDGRAALQDHQAGGPQRIPRRRGPEPFARG